MLEALDHAAQGSRAALSALLDRSTGSGSAAPRRCWPPPRAPPTIVEQFFRPNLSPEELRQTRAHSSRRSAQGVQRSLSARTPDARTPHLIARRCQGVISAPAPKLRPVEDESHRPSADRSSPKLLATAGGGGVRIRRLAARRRDDRDLPDRGPRRRWAAARASRARRRCPRRCAAESAIRRGSGITRARFSRDQLDVDAPAARAAGRSSSARTRSARRNITGYLSGLSSPSVTESAHHVGAPGRGRRWRDRPGCPRSR